MSKAEDTAVQAGTISRIENRPLRLDDFPLREAHNYHSSVKWLETASHLLGSRPSSSQWIAKCPDQASEIKNRVGIYLNSQKGKFLDEVIHFQVQDRIKVEVEGIELPPLNGIIEDPYLTCQFNGNQDKDWLVEVIIQGKRTIKVKKIFPERKLARAPETTATFLAGISANPGHLKMVGYDPYERFLNRFDANDRKTIEQAVNKIDPEAVESKVKLLPGSKIEYLAEPVGMISRATKVILEPDAKRTLKEIKNLQDNSNVDLLENR
jgi:hypothetical protein